MVRKHKTEERTTDPEVAEAAAHGERLLAEAARLTDSLNAHLDEIQELIEDRRKVS